MKFIYIIYIFALIYSARLYSMDPSIHLMCDRLILMNDHFEAIDVFYQDPDGLNIVHLRCNECMPFRITQDNTRLGMLISYGTYSLALKPCYTPQTKPEIVIQLLTSKIQEMYRAR